MPRPAIKKRCLHCRRVRWMQGRGLCAGCHRAPGVRALYPSLCGAVYRRDDPTAEELERTIAEQLAKPLPKWWARHCAIQRAKELPDGPPRIVAFVVRTGTR